MGPEAAAVFGELDRRFELAVAASVTGADRASVLFSGGVDSYLVASRAAAHLPVELVTVGREGSRDPAAATAAARALGLPHRVVAIEPSHLEELRGSVPLDWSALPEPARSVQVGLALALRATRERRVLAGQGADELFGGYAHFRGLGDEALARRRALDWSILRGTDWPMTLRVAEALGKELRAPFLDDPFAAFALALPIPRIGEGALTKPLLRDWAIARGVPESVAHRPKIALQYGTGVARMVHDHRRRPPPAGPRP